MITIQIVASALAVIAFIGILLVLLASTWLFYQLEKKYPTYYKRIGSPIVLPIGYAPTITTQLKGMSYLLGLAANGIPKGFPNNKSLQKRARVICYLYTAVFALIAAMLILIFISILI